MSGLELRAQSDGTVRLHGLASRFDSAYRIGSEHNPRSFIEKVAPGAFSRSVTRPDLDCILTVEHERRDTLARTPTTLTLTQTSVGLEFDATLDPGDPTAQQAVSRIERGTLKECSFAFTVPPGGDSWNSDRTERTINAADVHRGDVSLTVYGASSATGAHVVRASYAGFEERRAYTTAVSVLGVGGIGWERNLALRAGYAAHELAILGSQGKAYNHPDGHWSHPTATQQDLADSIEAAGRTGSAENPIRQHLIGRAKQMGRTLMIPASWRPDGSITPASPMKRRSIDLPPSRVDEFEAELTLLSAKAAVSSLNVREAILHRDQRAEQQRRALSRELAKRWTPWKCPD